MRSKESYRRSERGSAGVKFLLVLAGLIAAAHAGFNYIPVAYEGANFRQEMDTAVVKGISVTGGMKAQDVVKASIKRAINENNVPEDALIDIKPVNGVVQAHVSYSKPVQMLPFGLFEYQYEFDYVAAPQGYLLKD